MNAIPDFAVHLDPECDRDVLDTGETVSRFVEKSVNLINHIHSGIMHRNCNA